ncbi:MAG TPA: DUF2461 domain-containing protein [Streptosporangiaceae bacterium]|jgi:uncharacterized protein (TIGR02453 family)
MPFTGWPEEALDFYEGLEADNSRTYWTAHQQTYEQCVLAPMTELVAELAPQFGEGKIFRPHRDLRFSKDKSPYKTAIAAVVGEGYLQLSARGLAAGSGMYGMASDQLERYRRAVAAEATGTRLTGLVDELTAQGIRVEPRQSLKTAPRGYPAGHERIELLRSKGLIAWQEWAPEPWLGTPEAARRVAGFLTAARPLRGWLDEHVGPSTAAEPRR